MIPLKMVMSDRPVLGDCYFWCWRGVCAIPMTISIQKDSQILHSDSLAVVAIFKFSEVLILAVFTV